MGFFSLLCAGWLLISGIAFAGSYDLAALSTSADQDAAVLRMALRQCAKGDVIEGLTPQCQGTPTQAGLEAMLARRLGNILDSEVLQHINDQGNEAKQLYVTDPAARAVIDVELKKRPKP
jgi:hypothetical protein